MSDIPEISSLTPDQAAKQLATRTDRYSRKR
jgi:hypothetical protein